MAGSRTSVGGVASAGEIGQAVDCCSSTCAAEIRGDCGRGGNEEGESGEAGRGTGSDVAGSEIEGAGFARAVEVEMTKFCCCEVGVDG